MGKRSKSMIGVALGGLMLLGASPAFAQLEARTDGALAYENNCNRDRCGTRYHHVWIKDTKADGHPVKAEYERALTQTVNTLWEKRGNGYSNVTSDITGGVSAIQACEYINNWPDDCSGWDR